MRPGAASGICAAGLLAAIVACGSFGAAPEALRATDGGADAEADGASRAPCAARAITSWSKPRRMTELVGDGGEKGFAHPFVTADGLTLWVDRAAGGRFEVFRARRASRSAPFGTLERIRALEQSNATPYPSSARDGEVLVMRAGIRTDIALRAQQPDGGWSVTTIDPRPDNEAWPTLSGDGTLAVFLHFEAEPPERFFDVVFVDRARAADGEPWSQLDGLVEDLPDGGPALPNGRRIETPGLAPDGLGLFYSVDGRVFYLARPNRTAPFFTASSKPISIPALDAETDDASKKTAVRSLTADGCEVYLTSNRDGADDVYVAERGP